MFITCGFVRGKSRLIPKLEIYDISRLPLPGGVAMCGVDKWGSFGWHWAVIGCCGAYDLSVQRRDAFALMISMSPNDGAAACCWRNSRQYSDDACSVQGDWP
jgi:hypothetical protein